MNKSQREECDNYLIELINRKYIPAPMKLEYDNGLIELTKKQFTDMKKRETLRYHRFTQYQLFCKLNHEVIIKNIIEPSKELNKNEIQILNYWNISHRLFIKTDISKSINTISGIKKLNL